MKKEIKSALVCSGIFHLGSLFQCNRVVILRYHSILKEGDERLSVIGSGITHSESAFDEQMGLVVSRFDPVTLDDIQLCFTGKKNLPKRPVAVTFDDGFSDNEEVAAPILSRHGIRAAFFVTVDSIETHWAPWFARLRNAFAETKRYLWTEVSSGIQFDLTSPRRREQAFLCACERCAQLTGNAQARAVGGIEECLGVAPFSAQNKLMMDHNCPVKRIKIGLK